MVLRDGRVVRCDSALNVSFTRLPDTLVRQEAIFLSKDVDGFWLGTRDGIFNWQEDGELQHFLAGYTVTDLCHDHEGNLWFTTTQGVRKLGRLKVKRITIPGFDGKGLVNNLYVDSGRMVLTRANGYIHVFDHTGNHQNRTDLGAELLFLKPLRQALVVGGSGIYILDTMGRLVHDFYISGSNKDVEELGEDLLIATSNGLYLLSDWQSRSFDGGRVEADTLLRGRVFGLKTTGEITYAYAPSGLYEISDREARRIQVFSEGDFQINDVLRVGEELWIATDNHGIVIGNMTGQKAGLDQIDGLVGTSVVKLEPWDSGRVFAAGTDGFYVISGKTVEPFSGNLALEKEEIRDYTVHDGRLVVTASDGASLFDLSQTSEEVPRPQLTIKGLVMANNKQVTDGAKIAYSHRDLRIHFEPLSFSLADVQYRYRLAGDWVRTSSPLVELSGLQPGKYRLEAQVGNGEVWSETATLTFSIARPYWQKWWFRILVALLILLLVVGSYILLLRRSRRRAHRSHEIEKQLMRAEQRALRAQMNPHFIFNALNAIQNFIVHNKMDEAYSYLGKFSKLVRTVLHSSEHSWTPVSEEVKMLELYLSLESLRFESKFTYEIDASGWTDPTTEIPTMIVQPMVENAIIHGLLPMEGDDKQVRISFIQTRESAKICIEDNGVGMNKGLGGETPDRKSRGVSLTAERLSLLGKRGASIQVESPIDQERGTRVILNLGMDEGNNS